MTDSVEEPSAVYYTQTIIPEPSPVLHDIQLMEVVLENSFTDTDTQPQTKTNLDVVSISADLSTLFQGDSISSTFGKDLHFPDKELELQDKGFI